MGCTTSVPQTAEGLIESPKPDYIEDFDANDSGIEDSYSESLSISKTLVQARKDGFASENLQFLQKTFNEGVFASIQESQLKSLWNFYSCRDSSLMGESEMKRILGDYIEFCRDFSCEQIKRRKLDEKRQSVRSDEEIELSKRASITLVKCNSQRARIEKLMEKFFGKGELKWTKDDFLQGAGTIFFQVRDELKMQPWADSILGPVNYDAPANEPGWVKELQMELAQEKLKGEFSEGCLRICVIGACGLTPLAGSESCTPYAILSVANSNVPTVFKPGQTDPEWMQTFKFTRYMFRKASKKEPNLVKDRARLHIMDWDKELRKARLMGSVAFDLPNEFMDKPSLLELSLKMSEDAAKPACVMLSYQLKTGVE